MKNNKKETIILLIILAILIFFIASVITFVSYTSDDKNILYYQSEDNPELGKLVWDTYTIYNNGLVITNEHYEEEKFKISKITKEEVEELKILTATIEDNKKDIERPDGRIANLTKRIYSEKLQKNIILYNVGYDANYINDSENCEELLELIQNIYDNHKEK